jgi:hypothetical protein
MRALVNFFKTSPRTKGELVASLIGLILFITLLITGVISMVGDPKFGWLGTIGPISVGLIIICAGIALMNPPLVQKWLQKQ